MKTANIKKPTSSELEKLTSSLAKASSYQGDQLNDSVSSLKIEWLDSKQAAKHLCISTASLRNMSSNGKIPFYKLGKSNRYIRCQLDRLLLKEKRGRNVD